MNHSQHLQGGSLRQSVSLKKGGANMIMRNASRLLFGLFALMATFSLGIVLSPKILRASFVRRMAIIGKMAGLTSSPFPALAMTGASSSPKQSLTTACSDVRARNGRVSEPECKHAANLLDSCTKGRFYGSMWLWRRSYRERIQTPFGRSDRSGCVSWLLRMPRWTGNRPFRLSKL